MKVKITSINEAKIKTVHTELEGPEDEKHNVISLPLDMFVKMNEVDALMGCYEGQSVGDFYWVADEVGNFSARYRNMSAQQLKGVHNNGVLVIGTETFKNCRLTKAKFTPWDGGQAKLSVTISVINPKQEELDELLKYKGCKLPVSFIGDASLFEDDQFTEEDEQPDLLADPADEVIAQDDLSEDDISELDEDVIEEPAEEVVYEGDDE